MNLINNLAAQEWIEPKAVDRYWHLPPIKTEENQGALATRLHELRRKRIRRAQYAAIGTVNCGP